MYIAVLSIDYISSSTWTMEQRELVTNILTKELQTIQDCKFEFYRGDSLQLVLENPENSLAIALQLKTCVNKLIIEGQSNNDIQSDIRISIGIGIETLTKELIAQSDGTAYQFSGRRLDTMKAEQRVLCITSKNERFNAEFEVSTLFFEEIIKRWSIASAEAIYYTLKGYKEIPLSKLLNIGQPAVNKRKKVAGWHTIEAFIDRFEKAVQQEFLACN